MAFIDNPIRRSQLIVPFGVGASYVNKDGIRMLIAGIDNWFSENSDNRTSPESVFTVSEWRLSKRLNVNHFRLPPDFRQHIGDNVNASNVSVPTVRFPQWHHCPFCKHLCKEGLSTKGILYCQSAQCNQGRRKSKLSQVDLICCCENGHIHDFPWNEWVHQRNNPKCDGNKLKLITHGYISDATVMCIECGLKRSLTQTLSSKDFSTLVHGADGDYVCNGTSIWHGMPLKQEACGEKLYPLLLLRNNVYFPVVHSSIYVPRSQGEADEIYNLLDANKTYYNYLLLQNKNNRSIAQELRKIMPQFRQYTESQIVNTIEEYQRKNTDNNVKQINSSNVLAETQFRIDEYFTLSRSQNDKEIKVVPQAMVKYNPFVQKYFTKIHQITKLRETRVLEGFYRHIQGGKSQYDVKRHLFRDMPNDHDDVWLPAVVNIGEGFFIEFNQTLLHDWEKRSGVINRVNKFRFNGKSMPPNQPYTLSPRAVLLHTFAHLLMNRLAYTSGYNVASIRERVYVSEGGLSEMTGILIYTSSSDSEGSLGGLVRQSLPQRFDTLVYQALEYARWCSNDPVCSTDITLTNNDAVHTLAACHSCALVPETSCEFMNIFLDRALVVNNLADKDMNLGFFQLDE